MIDNIKKNIKHYIFNKLQLSNIVQNVGYDLSRNKSALIIYTTAGFHKSLNNSKHTNSTESLLIVSVFNELGFTVDILDCNDSFSLNLIKSKRYDIVFGFGQLFYELRLNNVFHEARFILYMTEHHPKISYQNECCRLKYYKARHGHNVPNKRSSLYYKVEHLDIVYDNIVVLGETYPYINDYDVIHQIFPTGMINLDFVLDFSNKQNNNFLWFGSNGAVHKGLDILIDSFACNPHLNLYIAGVSSSDAKLISDLIIKHDAKNIHNCGFLDTSSNGFIEIISKCFFAILPSCSEGFSTSIATLMNHGLIPIVNRNTGFNRLEDNAFFLEDYKVEYVCTYINNLQAIPFDELKAKSIDIYHFANKNFTMKVFRKTFADILKKILLK